MKNIYKLYLVLLIFVIFVYIVPKSKGFQNNHKFAVLAIFKNEEMGIREWIEHYLWQGADLIVLLDNNSTDNYRDKIKDFDANTVIVLPAKEKHAQVKHYSTAGLKTLRENNVGMVAVLDLDEFMFSKDGKPLKKTLIDIFDANKDAASITCNWTMFGSSSRVVQPISVRNSFTWKKSGLHQLPKSIYLVDKIKNTIDVHTTNNGKNIDGNERLQLNHYAIQSKEYFEKVKMTRGAADGIQHENLRDWKYFNSYDFHDEEDTLLIEHMNKL